VALAVVLRLDVDLEPAGAHLLEDDALAPGTVALVRISARYYETR